MGCLCIMRQYENDNTIIAGFPIRAIAYLIDIAILNIVLIFVRVPVWFVRIFAYDSFLFRDILFKFSIYDIFLYILSAFYFIAMTYFEGATVGKRVMSLKVENINGQKLTLLNVIYRETIGRYLSSILFIGYLMIIGNRNKLSLHDRLCDTHVIYDYSQLTLIPTVKPDEKENIQQIQNTDDIDIEDI